MNHPLEGLSHILEETLTLLWSYITSPQKRLFVGYLSSAAILACWVYIRTRPPLSLTRYLFPKHVWLGRSAHIDYLLALVNGLLKVALVGQFVGFSYHVAQWSRATLESTLGAPSHSLGETETLVVYTVALLLAGDLSVYLVHRAMHQIPVLWRFHKIHHSATTLTPFTLLRVHPVELLVNNGRSILMAGLVTGMVSYFTAHRIDVVTFLGVNMASFLFFTLGANLRHSQIPLAYWSPVERILSSPRQHQIHHSNDPAHHDRNFGSKFALWDWIGGSLVLSKDTKELTYGLGSQESKQYTTLKQALFSPFRP